MKHFEANFARWVIQHRWWVIAVSLAYVLALGYGTTRLYFDSSYRVFFGKDNPQLVAFEKLEDMYNKNDNVVLVLAPKNGDVFTQNNLAAIEALTTASWQVPFSSRVDSITNFQFTEAEDDDMVVRDMAKDSRALSDAEVESVRSAVLAEPALNKRLVSATGHVTGINITLQMQLEERTENTPKIVDFVRKMVAQFEAEHPDITVYQSGMIMMDNAFFESAMNDSAFLVPLSFFLMMALVALLVGGFFGTLTTLMVIVFSIVAALGVGGYVGYPLTSVTTSSPIIILTVAVANCIHLLVTFIHDMHRGESQAAAMEESLRINLQPVFLASATTAIGFITMNFSEVPPFGHLGTIVSVGVLVSFFLTVTFLPAVMSLVPVRIKAIAQDDYTMMSRLAEFVIAKRRLLLWSMTILILAAVVNLPRNELNDVFVHYFGKSIDFRNDTDFMLENMTGIYIINFSLDSGAAGGISDPVFLQETENFAQWLESQPEAVHVDRFTNVMKRLNKNMHGDDQSFYRIPDDRDLAAQYLLLYEMSLPFGLDLNNQINIDKSATKVALTTGLISSNEMIALDARANAWVRANSHAIRSSESAGTVLMFSNIGQRNIKAMLLGTTVALVLISGILVIALRSLKLGLISLLPNLVPAAVGFGLWGIFVGEVGLALSTVTGMSFGIVIDDTVHFLSKYLRARREKGLSSPDAVRYAFRTVGRALIVTTIVLVVGFCVLSTSSFALNSGMGLMTAVIITIALISVFLLLPPLLMKIEENESYAPLDKHTADSITAA